jgi:hypothetical protein
VRVELVLVLRRAEQLLLGYVLGHLYRGLLLAGLLQDVLHLALEEEPVVEDRVRLLQRRHVPLARPIKVGVDPRPH